MSQAARVNTTASAAGRLRAAGTILPALLGGLLLAACSPSGEDSTSPRYEANIRWTSYGIPHVLAGDWGGLGYGFAYATARDAVCTIARDVLMVNGDLSRFEGEGSGNLHSDVFHRAVLDEAMIASYRQGQTEQSVRFSEGYVAGYNRYLRDNADSLPAACAGEEWVRPISLADVDRLTVGVGIRYGLGRYQREMANAAPPGQLVASLESDFDMPAGIGSNAVAMGSAVTENGRGLLLGNPHYPWQGSSRFHMIHTTIPGEVDVMGVSLYTTSRVSIGFNADVAWSHTVSTGLRSTLYALELDPEDPTRYQYGDGFRSLEEIRIAVPVRTGDGSIETRHETVYMSHYGPVLVSDQLPWTNERAFAIRDANLHNDRSALTYDALNKARSIDEVEAALHLQGVSWVNTIAADRQGTAFYADISTVPNVDAELFERCRLRLEGVPEQLVVLNGADPGCEWKQDSRSAIPGTMPPQEMPRLRREDYVHNANDSYWLSNPQQPLTGYSPIIGSEDSPVTLRTRAGLHFIDEALQETEGMTPQRLQDMLFSQRNFGAELLLDEVLGICDSGNGGQPAPVRLEQEQVDITPSCEVLAAWDRRATNTSRGVPVWREFWRRAQRIPGLYSVPFDVADPVHTPRGINLEDEAVREALGKSLAEAQLALARLNMPLDAPLGELQFETRNGEHIPIPGGEGWAGMWSVIVTQPTQEGYTPIIHGNSYMQVVGWNDDGTVNPRAVLSYSQSEDPESPHFADQTRLYSEGQMLDLPFYEADIQADPNLVQMTISE